jgi:hypothetical protein
VPEGAAYDLMMAINAIQEGDASDPDLFVRAERVTKTADFTPDSDSDSDSDSSSD